MEHSPVESREQFLLYRVQKFLVFLIIVLLCLQNWLKLVCILSIFDCNFLRPKPNNAHDGVVFIIEIRD